MTTAVCPNWQRFLKSTGRCEAATHITPMATVVQLYIDWFIIIGSLICTVLYINRAFGFYNIWKESVAKAKFFGTNFLFIACIVTIVACVGGFFSKMTNYMHLEPAKFTVAFVIPWAQSFVMIWVATNLIQAHYIDVFVVRFEEGIAGLAKYSFIIKALCVINIILAITYDAYIIAVTIIYKSQNAKIVEIGWILMSLPYVFLFLVGLCMFIAVQNFQEYANTDQRISASNTILTWSIGTLLFSGLSITTIYIFSQVEPIVSKKLGAEATEILTIGTATYESYHIREKLNYWNYGQLALNLFILGFENKIIIPLWEIYLAIFPEKRRQVYGRLYPGTTVYKTSSGDTTTSVALVSVSVHSQAIIVNADDTTTTNVASGGISKKSSALDVVTRRTDYSRRPATPKKNGDTPLAVSTAVKYGHYSSSTKKKDDMTSDDSSTSAGDQLEQDKPLD